MPEADKELPPEALRALAEAEQRRLKKKEVNLPKNLVAVKGKNQSDMAIGRKKE